MRKLLCVFGLILNGFLGVSQNNALVLNGAYIRLNGGTSANPIFIVINQPQTTGIIRPGGGHIHSENQFNFIKWVTSTTTGNYVFPFGVNAVATDYIPFEFNKITAGNTNLTVSTFSTNSANLPFPTPVTSMTQASNSIDRFWDIRSSATVTSNLTFRYRGIENTTGLCATDTVKAQYWTNAAGPWSSLFGPGNPGVTVGIGAVGAIPNQSYFQPTATIWALTTVPISPTITASSSITCNGANNGSATVTTSGGLGAYTYAWLPSAATGSAATGLTPGTHTVTVTGANTCSQTRTISISQPPAITLTVNQTQVTCSSLASATITPTGGTPNYTAYTWNPVVSATNIATGLSAGNYTATVFDNNGCQRSATVTITSNTVAPTVTATASSSLNCQVTSTTVVLSTTTTPVTYTWTGTGITSGAGSATATVNSGGTYNYTVTDSNNGCATNGSLAVIQNTTGPSVTAAASSSLNCQITSTTVVASTTASPVTYAWSGPGITGGSSNASATVNLGGNYVYTVTNTNNSCTSTGTVAVIQNTTSPTVAASASSSLNCQVTSTTVVASTTTTPVSYNWTGPGITGGSTTASATVNAGGTYNYTVTNNSNQCLTVGSVSVTQNNTLPSVAASASGSINCTTTTVQTIASTTSTPVSYTWTGPGIVSGANTASATVNVGGTYDYTATNTFNQCSVSGSVSVTQSSGVPAVTASASGSLNCQITSTTVVASTTASPVTYTWSGPGITAGSGNATATVNLGGNYIYTVTNTSNNCTATGTVAVTQNTTAPAANASNSGVVNCTNTAVNLSSTSSNVTYTWVAPAGSSVASANNANTGANGGGTYTIFITSTVNSCTNSATTAITTQTNNPTANIINTPTITCSNSTVTINGSPASGVTYTWSGPAIVGTFTTANVSANGTGVYSLSVTSNSNGCTSSTPATVQISANTVSPSITMGSNPTIPCTPATVQITSTVSPGTATISWSGPNVCGNVNSATATACAPGNYTLTATDPANGCSSVSSLTVNPNAGLNVAVANTGTIYCSQASVQVVASATPATNNTYSWSGPGIVSGNGTETVTVNQGGTYTVTVTNTVSGCSFPITNVVVADNAPVNPNASPDATITCNSPSVNLTTNPSGSGPFTYTWSTGANSSSITETPTITTNYVVTVTNTANGCTGSQTITISADVNPPTGVSVSPSNGTLTCGNPTVALNGTATGASTYTWISSGPTFTTSANQATVDAAGTYTMIALAANGCSASAIATISPNSAAPTFTISEATPSITCSNSAPTITISITSSVAIQGYTWSPTSGISGATNTNIATFTTSGIYTAVISDINGCTSSATVSVTDATVAPDPAGTATAQPLSCTNTIVTIAPTFTDTNLSYSWSGPGIVGGSSGSSIQANQSGSYSLTVTNTLTGCSTTSIVVPVTGNNTVPTLTVSSSSTIGISCQPNTSTVSLDAQSSTAGVTYSWSTGANTQTISTSTPGIYTVTVSDANNCSSFATIAVQNNTVTPSITASSLGNLPCGGGTTSLSVVSSNTNISYSWSGSGITNGSNTATPEVNQAGTYTVVAIDNITGCQTTETISITQTTVSALASADFTTGPAPLTVNFNNQSTGATTYSWTFGDGNSSISTNPSNVFTTSGTYSVVLITTNGSCIASDTIFIKVNAGLEIPEIFTPNGDNLNDVFYIKGLESYPNASIQIFNRWGNPVYNSNPYKNNWDGSPNAAGKTGSGKLPTSTYFYILELGDKDNTIIRGYVQIQY